MLAALKQHLGITVLPDILLQDALQNGELIDIMPGCSISLNHLPVEHVYALYPNRQHLPAKVRAFVDFFRAKFSQSRQAL